MNVGSALVWAFVATAVQTILEAAGRGLGLTRISVPFLLGTLFTRDRDRAGWLGFVLHLVAGWVIGLGYALVFEALGRATWWIGGIAGLVHGLFLLAVVMPLLPTFHPRVAGETQGPASTPLLEPPGFMAANYGRLTTLVTLGAHLAFGVTMGALYRPEHGGPIVF